MPSPQSQGELQQQPNIIYETHLTYHTGTSFLAPDGWGSVRFQEITEPTLEQALATPPKSMERRLEVTMVSLYAALRFDAILFGREHNATGKPLVPVGEPWIATDWRLPQLDTDQPSTGTTVVRFPYEERGRYTFTPLGELADAPELPLYTAEWLARLLHRTVRPENLGLLRLLTDKPPLRLLRGTRIMPNGQLVPHFENKQERVTRLTRALLKARPDLLNRFLYRGIAVDPEEN